MCASFTKTSFIFAKSLNSLRPKECYKGGVGAFDILLLPYFCAVLFSHACTSVWIKQTNMHLLDYFVMHLMYLDLVLCKFVFVINAFGCIHYNNHYMWYHVIVIIQILYLIDFMSKFVKDMLLMHGGKFSLGMYLMYQSLMCLYLLLMYLRDFMSKFGKIQDARWAGDEWL